MKELIMIDIRFLIDTLQKQADAMVQPASLLIVKKYGKDPFLILIGCLLSLRTRDQVSFSASCRLFEVAKTPQAMLQLSDIEIQKMIYPVLYYRRKAGAIRLICQQLIEKYGGLVPRTFEELMQLPGVGLKTASLVRAEAFDIPSLIVDTHVHRMSNRLGIVSTKTPEKTERALRMIIPQELWIAYSRVLLTWGQNICTPIGPKCSSCPLAPQFLGLCDQMGVLRSR